MLKKFLYLDIAALDSYVSALEDGLTTRKERQSGKSSGINGTLGTSGANIGGSRGKDAHETTELSDTPEAKFERLQQLAAADFESTGWIVLDELSQLGEVASGSLVNLQCDVYIPDVVKMLSGGNELGNMMEMVETFGPLASSLDLDMESMPSGTEMAAIKTVMDRMSPDLIIVGEDDSDWKIAGKLASAHTRDIGDIEGDLFVVGKVSQRWSNERWKPLLALPGAGLLPRTERKALEKKKPSDDDSDQFLEGPAVMLDILAIYR